MTTAIVAVAAVVALLLIASAAIAPTVLVRLLTLAYPPAHPRRAELRAEICARTVVERFNLAIELCEAVIRDPVVVRRPAAHVDDVLEGAAQSLQSLRFWATGTVLRVRFLDSPELGSRVMAAAAAWTDHANLAFRVVEDGPAEIRITFEGVNNWSALGSDALVEDLFPLDGPTMGLREVLTASPSRLDRVVRHEFGHALGLVDEHSHPRSGIRWNKPVVYGDLAKRPNCWSTETVDANLFRAHSEDSGSPKDFDPESVMMYTFPPTWTLDKVTFPAGHELSVADREFVARIYPR